MPQITPLGQLNTQGLVVPDAIIQIVPPGNRPITGAPTNILGLVGTAVWGPVNRATVVGGNDDFLSNFGPIQNRANDLGTAVAVAVQQGANNFKCVRVTDGTDTAATAAIKDSGGTSTGITITAKYTGSLGNQIRVTLAQGSAASSTKAIIAMPNVQPEVFDNISGTGNAFWTNLSNAINNGQSGLRGPSNIVIATAGAGTASATNATTTLSGGADGATTVTAATLVGVDTTPRKGMYALRNQGCAVVNLVDLTDTTQFTTMNSFGLSEGAFMVAATVSGDTISSFATEVSGAGVDSYGLKVMFGDWIYWNDQVNGGLRLLSPATFWAGLRVATSPQNSALNKPMAGIVGTQKASTGSTYSEAELQSIISARGDVICNPAPGGAYYAVRSGTNVSSNPAVQGENYTMMTNFLAKSIASWAGSVVGQLQNPTQRRQAKASLDNFFAGLFSQNMIGNAQGTIPWQVAINDTTTPPALAALGYEIAAVKVQYLAVIRWFIVNMEGGQTVSIAVTPNAPQFAQAS